MIGPENNGRIKVTFAQAAWATTLLITILAAWFDMRYQVKAALERIDRNTMAIAGNSAQIANLESIASANKESVRLLTRLVARQGRSLKDGQDGEE